MTNDEHDLTPENDVPASDFDQSGDDLRYAPPISSEASKVIEQASKDDTLILSETDEIDNSPLVSEAESVPESDIAYAPVTPEPSVEVAADSLPVTVTDGLDIEAALAAVSTLSDVMAEQEAAEQARVARIAAEEQAKIERQARMDNPERFFPVPPLTVLKRGQLTSIIPAVWLIGLGAWLTFSLTTTHAAPNSTLLSLVIVLGLGLTFIARWLTSHRWARGSLFFGIVCLLFGGLFFYVNQPGAYSLDKSWPLFITALGLAMLLTRIFTGSSEKRLTFPSMILIIAGLVGTVVTMGLLPSNLTLVAASLWPVAIVIVVVVWLFPLVFRQRQ